MPGFEEEMAPIEEAEEQEVVCHVPESPTESGTSGTNSSKLSYHERLNRTRKTMNDMESEASYKMLFHTKIWGEISKPQN